MRKANQKAQNSFLLKTNTKIDKSSQRQSRTHVFVFPYAFLYFLCLHRISSFFLRRTIPEAPPEKTDNANKPVNLKALDVHLEEVWYT